MSTLNPILRAVAQWNEADRELFEERAAIMEFDGNMRRDIAEGRPFEAVKQIRAERERLGFKQENRNER